MLAEADLFGLYDYIASWSGPVVAAGYIDRIEAPCANLASLPDRGVPRNDLALGIRTIAMERRTLVVYQANSEAVTILRVLYARREFSVDDLPR